MSNSHDHSQMFDREELLAPGIHRFHTDFPPKIKALRGAATAVDRVIDEYHRVVTLLTR